MVFFDGFPLLVDFLDVIETVVVRSEVQVGIDGIGPAWNDFFEIDYPPELVFLKSYSQNLDPTRYNFRVLALR